MKVPRYNNEIPNKIPRWNNEISNEIPKEIPNEGA